MPYRTHAGFVQLTWPEQLCRAEANETSRRIHRLHRSLPTTRNMSLQQHIDATRYKTATNPSIVQSQSLATLLHCSCAWVNGQRRRFAPNFLLPYLWSREETERIHPKSQLRRTVWLSEITESRVWLSSIRDGEQKDLPTSLTQLVVKQQHDRESRCPFEGITGKKFGLRRGARLPLSSR